MEFYGFECETHENFSIRNDQMLMKCEKAFAITEWQRVISHMLYIPMNLNLCVQLWCNSSITSVSGKDNTEQ